MVSELDEAFDADRDGADEHDEGEDADGDQVEEHGFEGILCQLLWSAELVCQQPGKVLASVGIIRD